MSRSRFENSNIKPESLMQAPEDVEISQIQDQLVDFVSDMAEMENVDVPEETLLMLKDSLVEGTFEFHSNFDEIADEILSDRSQNYF